MDALIRITDTIEMLTRAPREYSSVHIYIHKSQSLRTCLHTCLAKQELYSDEHFRALGFDPQVP